MKTLVAIVALLTSPAWAQTCLFGDTLVTGASISAGYGARRGGPSLIIAETLDPHARVDVQARGGMGSVDIIRELNVPAAPSLIMAVDLFFWDAARDECGPTFEASTRAFIDGWVGRGVPLVIGRIPVGATFPEGIRLGAATACGPKVNALLAQLCTPERNCLLYDPLDCFTAMGGPGGYFFDALHTNHQGNQFCARRFIADGRWRQLRCAP